MNHGLDQAGAAPMLLPLAAVLATRGVKRTRHYADIRRGLWTKPVSLGRHRSAWPSNETQALVAATVAGASAEQIRELVESLHARRRAAFEAIGSRYLNQSAAAAT